MSAASLSSFIGAWKGRNCLWVSKDEPVRASESTASVGPATRDKGLVLHYTWMDGGEPHAGTLLIQHNARAGTLSGAWTDSWHQGNELMICHGVVNADGHIEVDGSYPAPPGPDWRWKIVVASDAPDSLVLRMFNISPEGQSDLAVEASYRRHG